MEVLTLILGLVGSVGTIYSLVATFVLSRVNIDVEVLQHNKTPIGFMFLCSFVNRSHLSVAITNISVVLSGKRFDCSRVPSVVIERTKKRDGVVISHEQEKTMVFPIVLPSLSGTSGYLTFRIPQDMLQSDAKALTVELSTNRFRRVKKKLSLSPDLEASFLR